MGLGSGRRTAAITAAAAVAAGSGCAGAHRIELDVLDRPEVEVPPAVRTIGIVDRAGPRNVGQQLLGAVEGLLTGESLEDDTNGRASAVQSAVAALRASPRFDAVTLVSVDANASKSTLFDRELDWHTTATLAKQSHVDALLALETFDTDSDVDASPPTAETSAWTARRDTSVLTTWRLYDPSTQQVVDVLRETRDARTWTVEGPTRAASLAGLPDTGNTVIAVGRLAGEAYARRIGPPAVRVERAWYASGNKALREAAPYVRAGDWGPAIEAWHGLSSHRSAKVRGRASTNLALAAEVDGDLDLAIRYAEQAAVALDSERSRAYVTLLTARKRGTTTDAAASAL